MRADLMLVEQGHAPSRSAAQRLIERGAVRWRPAPQGGLRNGLQDGVPGGAWQQPRKAGEELPAGCEIEVTDDAELRWASRAGLKLEGALDALRIDVEGATVLDVGQSTGGFTDVLLARGAARVVGVDVGHGQLLQRLRDDARVTVFEGLNARELTPSGISGAFPHSGFDLIVGDLSFISLTLVLPALKPLLAEKGTLLMLVKPQFELQASQLARGGLVRDETLYAEVQARIRAACAAVQFDVRDWIESPIKGGDGNREFFVQARIVHKARAVRLDDVSNVADPGHVAESTVHLSSSSQAKDAAP